MAQMIGQYTGVLFEHRTASSLPQTPVRDLPGYAPVDDDYYYEMVAIRAFEKYGIGLTVEQLGQRFKMFAAGLALCHRGDCKDSQRQADGNRRTNPNLNHRIVLDLVRRDFRRGVSSQLALNVNSAHCPTKRRTKAQSGENACLHRSEERALSRAQGDTGKPQSRLACYIPFISPLASIGGSLREFVGLCGRCPRIQAR
jgi:hypothetical protein